MLGPGWGYCLLPFGGSRLLVVLQKGSSFEGELGSELGFRGSSSAPNPQSQTLQRSRVYVGCSFL